AARTRAATHPPLGQAELPHVRRAAGVLPRASDQGVVVSVALVGAGPGDPELITVRGLARVRVADVLVYDRLVSPELVAEAPAQALRIARDDLTQAEVNDALIDYGRRSFAVRLKGGDPFVF